MIYSVKATNKGFASLSEIASAENTVKHLAIIMDGNRRWAKAKGLPSFAGHRAGVESLKRVVKACPDQGIEYLTVYVFSTENWARQIEEVKFLFDLLQKVLGHELNELKKQGVKLRFIGDLDSLESELRFKLLEAQKETAQNNKLTLQIALNYGGRAEITHATKQIAKLVGEGKLQVEDINQELVSENLYTTGIPDPDLLIRTGGDSRVSNYLLWQIAYSEIIVHPTLWPDFDESTLDECLKDFSGRARRFGK